MYLDKYKLTGKVAVITGAARGIGFASADALSEAGAHVVISDMDGASADKAVAALKAKGRSASSYVLNAVSYTHLDVYKRQPYHQSWWT